MVGFDLGWAYFAVKGEPTNSILKRRLGTRPTQRRQKMTTSLSELLHLHYFLEQLMQPTTQTAMHTAPTHCPYRPKILESKSLLIASQALVHIGICLCC